MWISATIAVLLFFLLIVYFITAVNFITAIILISAINLPSGQLDNNIARSRLVGKSSGSRLVVIWYHLVVVWQYPITCYDVGANGVQNVWD